MEEHEDKSSTTKVTETTTTGLIDKYGISKVVAASKKILSARKIYNNACRVCQHKMRTDPQRPITDYCHICQSMMKRVWGDD